MSSSCKIDSASSYDTVKELANVLKHALCSTKSRRLWMTELFSVTDCYTSGIDEIVWQFGKWAVFSKVVPFRYTNFFFTFHTRKKTMLFCPLLLIYSVWFSWPLFRYFSFSNRFYLGNWTISLLTLRDNNTIKVLWILSIVMSSNRTSSMILITECTRTKLY
jgi:hypothetical protein